MLEVFINHLIRVQSDAIEIQQGMNVITIPVNLELTVKDLLAIYYDTIRYKSPEDRNLPSITEED